MSENSKSKISKRLEEIKRDNLKNIEVEEEGLKKKRNVKVMIQEERNINLGSKNGESHDEGVEEEEEEEEDEEVEVGEEEEEKDEFTSDANEVVEIKLVHSAEDLQNSELTFNPEYMHQIYGQDEQIIGYKNLKIKLYYNAATLNTYASMEYEAKMTKDNDITPLEYLTKQPIQWGSHESAPIVYSLSNSIDDFIAHLNDPFVPPGNLMTSYQDNNSKTFEIYQGCIENAKMKEYHDRIQTFALMYIDAASYINPEEGKWQIFLLFKKTKRGTNDRYTFAGYTTVYPYFAYPDNVRLRVSQFLILPPFRRQGHGERLLNAVYAHSKSINCIDVCVETPSEGFQILRDKTDLRIFSDLMKTKGFCNGESSLPKWDKTFWQSVRDKSKLPRDQIRRCYEIYKLMQIRTKSLGEEEERKYRLEVKRRLYNLYDMATMAPTTEERKEKLCQIYEELLQEYMAVLKVTVIIFPDFQIIYQLFTHFVQVMKK